MHSANARVNIGQAADASGVSAKMVRHYEAIGLLPAPTRTSGNYRTYGERNDLDRKIAELGSMRKTLQHLVAACHADERPDCPILVELASTRSESCSTQAAIEAPR